MSLIIDPASVLAFAATSSLQQSEEQQRKKTISSIAQEILRTASAKINAAVRRRSSTAVLYSVRHGPGEGVFRGDTRIIEAAELELYRNVQAQFYQREGDTIVLNYEMYTESETVEEYDPLLEGDTEQTTEYHVFKILAQGLLDEE